MVAVHMDDQNKNLILATVLSFLVVVVWVVLFPAPEPEPTVLVDVSEGVALPGNQEFEAALTVDNQPGPTVDIDTPSLTGSISLNGGRIDALSLKKYRNTLNPDSGMVRLLTPAGQKDAYYALFGWGPSGALEFADVPGANTPWKTISGGVLTPETPLVLEWENTKGLRFVNEIAVDEKYMFTVTQRVENTSAQGARLYPYGIVVRHGEPSNLENFFISHEGVVGRTDGTLSELDYDDVVDLPVVVREGARAELIDAATDGWIGFSDKYWMSVLIPEQGKPFTSVTKFVPQANTYQVEVREATQDLAPGATISSTQRFFSGAKQWEVLRAYMNEGALDESAAGAGHAQPIAGFVDSIDWGWFFFLTKPIFALLHWLNAVIGNMGLAIIALTFILKILVLPLAYKSYVSMARMKELQPEMEALKARAGDDKQLLQREMMKLYRDKKVNPAAGCLPILIQVPIFFSLYKVIFVTIELRQAPFYLWLRDLSQPDPSSIFNLFGLLPWAAPAGGTILALIFIGVLPILLGVTMWMQQRLNPAPTDQMQKQIFAWMPWVFMFMLGGFASGLVLYWIANNIITFSQQYMIMRSHGHKPDVFGNIRQSLSRKTAKSGAASDKK